MLEIVWFFFTCRWKLVYMFCSFYLILYIIWFHFSLSLSPFYYFDYYEHQYFTSVLFHMFSFIKNALFGLHSWMSHRTFIESSAVTTAFWLDQYGGRFVSIFRRCPPCFEVSDAHWPQYMDSWLARFCILANACHRKPLGSHFTPVKTLDRHTDLCTCQCMKCNRWQVFSFKFHENFEKKNGKVPQIFKTLRYLLKIAKKKLLILINLKFVQY